MENDLIEQLEDSRRDIHALRRENEALKEQLSVLERNYDILFKRVKYQPEPVPKRGEFSEQELLALLSENPWVGH